MSGKLVLSSFAAVLLSAAAPALAEGRGAAALDTELQGLKGDSLALQRALQDFQSAQSFPAGSRASVYVASTVPGLLLDTLTVRLDGKELANYRYSGSEARALQKRGWHRLKALALDAGSHRLQATFSGHYWNAPDGEPALTGQADGSFDKGATDVDVLFTVTRAGLHDPPVLSAPVALKPAAPASEDDPRYRAALFLANDNRYVSALTELLAVNPADPAAVPFQALLAASYADFGMEDTARGIDRRLASAAPDSIAAMRARLDLARLEYDRGNLAASAASLELLRDHLVAPLREEWRTDYAETLLAQGRNADAVALLSDGASLTPAQRFNLGIALVGAGRSADGLKQIDAVGTMDAKGGEALALRDKANLILGYQYLNGQNGDAARTAFRRVSPQGPFSNRAMLGLGWAEVASAGGGEPSADAVQRAIAPWVELIKRDPMDPAVEEGFLAIAWSLERLHSDEQSIAYYQRATAVLEQARSRIQEAHKAIRNGSMLYTMVGGDLDSERGWKWRLTDLSDSPETYFLQKLLAQHRFEEVLKDYRDALLLGRSLSAWKNRLDAATAPKDLLDRIDQLVPKLDANAAAQRRLLEAAAITELDGQQQQVERYLAESRSAVARLYERQIQETP